LYWRLTENVSRVILVQVLGLPLMFLMIFGFGLLAITVGRPPASADMGVPELLIILAGIAVMIVLHELAHGLAMWVFGARPRYGILWRQLVFYATAPGFGFRRNSYVVVALAPFVLLSLLGVLGIWALQGTFWVGLISLCAGLNGGGAAGDLWMAAIVMRYPRQAMVVDERDGLRVLLKRNGGAADQ
jgi:hypothetical protein